MCVKYSVKHFLGVTAATDIRDSSWKLMLVRVGKVWQELLRPLLIAGLWKAPQWRIWSHCLWRLSAAVGRVTVRNGSEQTHAHTCVCTHIHIHTCACRNTHIHWDIRVLGLDPSSPGNQISCALSSSSDWEMRICIWRGLIKGVNLCIEKLFSFF